MTPSKSSEPKPRPKAPRKGTEDKAPRAKRKPAPAPRPARSRSAGADLQPVALALAAAALDKKAEDPVVLDVQGLISYADFVLVVTGTSAPHVEAIAEHLVAVGKQHGLAKLAVEGGPERTWLLVDLGDIIIHVFQQQERGYYDIEGMWPDAERVAVPGAPFPVPNQFVAAGP